MADLEVLQERLRDLADELADAAMEALREAIEAGEGRPQLERRLTQARRAVERAVHLLEGATVEDDADG